MTLSGFYQNCIPCTFNKWQKVSKSHDLEAARNLASTEEFHVAYLVLTYAAKALSTVRECVPKIGHLFLQNSYLKPETISVTFPLFLTLASRM